MKPCSPVGTVVAALEAPESAAARHATASSSAGRAERTVIPRFRHAHGPSRPSDEGREERPGGENARVVARLADELDRRGEAVFRRAARQRERRPAEAVERVREADAAAAQLALL